MQSWSNREIYLCKYIKNTKLVLEDRPNSFVSNFAYPVVSENRQSIVTKLQESKVEVRPLIAGAMHKKPFVKKYITNQSEKEFPNCELIDREGFYLPNHQHLTEENIKFIADIVNE